MNRIYAVCYLQSWICFEFLDSKIILILIEGKQRTKKKKKKNNKKNQKTKKITIIVTKSRKFSHLPEILTVLADSIFRS